MKPLPRGIEPALLLSQVRNTMPYLFEPGTPASALGRLEPARFVLDCAREPGRELTHLQYFKLCLSAHYLTVATPVPTDVDNQIRLRLWPAQLPVETALEMARLALESRDWGFEWLTNRVAHGAVGSPWEKTPLTAHSGEWLTVASGAYCALRRYPEPEARVSREALRDAIALEAEQEADVFGSLWRANEGFEALRAATNIAHNLGDLDRVLDLWELPPDDPLRAGFYKLSSVPFDRERKLRYQGRLWVAGELYKAMIDGSSMALENHRHFALRKPRCLRSRPELRLPVGPFFDAWAETVASELPGADDRPGEELREVADALAQGWARLPKTFGYGRALLFLNARSPEIGRGEPPRDRAHRKALELPREEFERRWGAQALRHLDEIPGRAQ